MYVSENYVLQMSKITKIFLKTKVGDFFFVKLKNKTKVNDFKALTTTQMLEQVVEEFQGTGSSNATSPSTMCHLNFWQRLEHYFIAKTARYFILLQLREVLLVASMFLIAFWEFFIQRYKIIDRYSLRRQSQSRRQR